jgi:transposase-like protein
MPKRRKNDTQEFRDGAVDLLRTSDQPLSQVARELGVSVASLRN